LFINLPKQLLIGLGVFILCLVVVGLNILRMTHQQIDAIQPALPDYDEIRASARVENLPIAIEWLETARIASQRSLVLDSQVDPEPDLAYEMTFPAFVLTWADGRRFVIDAGLSPVAAEKFGRPLTLFTDSGPMSYVGALSTLVRPESITGMGFTHLHVDHTSGANDLCAAGADFILYQTVEQFNVFNYLTYQQDDQLAQMDCSLRLLLASQDDLLREIQGFPGLYVTYVAGHSPGSQAFVVHVRQGRRVVTYIVAGDLANHRDGVLHNIAKPSWYSRWVVPESLQQLDQARRWLKFFDDQASMTVLLSHDRQALLGSGIGQMTADAND
jgi:glyoxylase-like metal-dependent hydrolase (beta-lactamase superfamily II)